MIKAIVYSHGFGVKADARGMFTEIAAAFPEYKSVMFDYNEVLPNGDMIVAPMIEQAEKLQNVINETDAEKIVLLCHSQGCLVAGLTNISKVSQVILIAPPVIASEQRVIDKLDARPGSELNLNGVSKYPRTDGSMSYLPKEYIEGFKNMEPISLYDAIAHQKPTVIIRATEDDKLGMTNVHEITAARVVDLRADHDFTGESRQDLIDILRSESCL